MTAKRKLKTITTKEAAEVMNKSVWQVRRDFSDLREDLGKKDRQTITVWEFCQAFKYNIDDVYELLEWDKQSRKSK